MARNSLTAAGTRRRGAGKKGVALTKGVPGEAVDELPKGEVVAGGEVSHDRAGAATGAAVPGRLQRWLERARALGLREPEDLVFELHVRQGLPLLVVAQALDLNLATVRALWEVCRVARAAKAPKSEAELAALREHLSAVLWQTVEATFPAVPLLDAEVDADEDEEEPGLPTPPMLSVRLKALDQIAKLYDVGAAQSAAAGGGPLPYATPEEIAAEVRLRVLEMYGRGDETRMTNDK